MRIDYLYSAMVYGAPLLIIGFIFYQGQSMVMPPEFIIGTWSALHGTIRVVLAKRARDSARASTSAEAFIAHRVARFQWLKILSGTAVLVILIGRAIRSELGHPSFATSITERYLVIGLLALVLLCTVDLQLLNYRLREGYFGYNEGEAREFLRFLLADDNQGDRPLTGLHDLSPEYGAEVHRILAEETSG